MKENINLEEIRVMGDYWIESNWHYKLIDKDVMREAFIQMSEGQKWNIEQKIKYFFKKNISPILTENIITYLKQFGIEDKTETENELNYYEKLLKFLQAYPKYQTQLLTEEEMEERDRKFDQFSDQANRIENIINKYKK